jgi:hypothetical protein
VTASDAAGTSRNRRGFAVVVVGIIVLLTAAVGLALRTEPVDPDIAFADVTWAELSPPGSVILETRAKRPPPGQSLVGRGQIYYGTNASEGEVRAFYAVLLASRPGWVPDGSTSAFMTTPEIDACTWHNGHVTLRLGMRNMQGWRELRAPDRGWPTVFSIEVLNRSSDDVAATACLSDR